MPRRWVSLAESFKIAGKASTDAPGPWIEERLGTWLLFGIWWWLMGVPQDRPKSNGPSTPN
jgi:hypothetical protein